MQQKLTQDSTQHEMVTLIVSVWCAQVVYKVYDHTDLEPLLEQVNAERQKEKDEES